MLKGQSFLFILYGPNLTNNSREFSTKTKLDKKPKTVDYSRHEAMIVCWKWKAARVKTAEQRLSTSVRPARCITVRRRSLIGLSCTSPRIAAASDPSVPYWSQCHWSLALCHSKFNRGGDMTQWNTVIHIWKRLNIEHIKEPDTSCVVFKMIFKIVL